VSTILKTIVRFFSSFINSFYPFKEINKFLGYFFFIRRIKRWQELFI